MADFSLSLIYLTDAYRVGETVVPKVAKDWQTLLLVDNPDRIAFRGAGLVELAARDELVLMEASALSHSFFEQAILAISGEFVVFASHTDELHYEKLHEALSHAANNNLDLLIENDGSSMADFFIRSKLVTSKLATELFAIDPRFSPKRLRAWLDQVSSATEFSRFGFAN